MFSAAVIADTGSSSLVTSDHVAAHDDACVALSLKCVYGCVVECVVECVVVSLYVSRKLSRKLF